MPRLIDFLPLRAETILTVRARLDADVNAGLAPEDELFIDTVEGGFYFDMTQPVALEIERLWDFLGSEVPAAAFVTYAFGTYLDQHGEVLGVPRKSSALANGEVTFVGTNGVAIGTGTVVAVVNADPDSDEEISFRTTEAGTISGGEVSLSVEAEDPGSDHNVGAGTITLLISPINGITSVTNAVATGGGTDVEEDEAYRARLLLELSSPGGQGNQADYQRWALGFSGVGFAKVNPLWKGPGTVQVLITDTNNDPVGQVVEDELQELLDPPVATTLLNGAQNLTSGTLTVDSTTDFRTATVGSPQHLNILDYIISYTGKTATTFTGCTGGTSVVAPDDSEVHQGGVGAGLAPVGAEVTVDTPTATTVTIVAAVTTYEGWSLDGDAGTIAIRDEVETAVRDYVDALPPGEDVRLNHVEAAFFNVEGVYDVGSVTINGSAANLSIGIDPPAVASIGVLTGITWAGATASP